MPHKLLWFYTSVVIFAALVPFNMLLCFSIIHVPVQANFGELISTSGMLVLQVIVFDFSVNFVSYILSFHFIFD